MKVYIIRERLGIHATGEYNPETNGLVALAGSILSQDIAHSEKFRGAKTIEKTRAGVMNGCVLLKDIPFKSASTAGNFVTGRSTNGLIAWKNEDGVSIKDLISRS